MIQWGIYTGIFLTGDLQVALKGSGVRFGIYHAMIEWFNPIWLADQRNNLTTQHYVKVSTPVHVLKADEHDLSLSHRYINPSIPPISLHAIAHLKLVAYVWYSFPGVHFLFYCIFYL